MQNLHDNWETGKNVEVQLKYTGCYEDCSKMDDTRIVRKNHIKRCYELVNRWTRDLIKVLTTLFSINLIILCTFISS